MSHRPPIPGVSMLPGSDAVRTAVLVGPDGGNWMTGPIHPPTRSKDVRFKDLGDLLWAWREIPVLCVTRRVCSTCKGHPPTDAISISHSTDLFMAMPRLLDLLVIRVAAG